MENKSNTPDVEAFNHVCECLEAGSPLNFEMIGDVFGKGFWIMLVYALIDAQDAAVAIHGAIRKLREETLAEEAEPSDGPGIEVAV